MEVFGCRVFKISLTLNREFLELICFKSERQLRIQFVEVGFQNIIEDASVTCDANNFSRINELHENDFDIFRLSGRGVGFELRVFVSDQVEFDWLVKLLSMRVFEQLKRCLPVVIRSDQQRQDHLLSFLFCNVCSHILFGISNVKRHFVFVCNVREDIQRLFCFLALLFVTKYVINPKMQLTGGIVTFNHSSQHISVVERISFGPLG